MRFPWTPIAPAQSAPLLRVGFRRHGKIMSTDPLLLVDTGADGVLLNLALAKLMGFHDSDLVTEECKGANGLMTVHTPKNLAGTEIEIGGKWYPLPSLKFGKSVPISLLGRDLIFAHFDLRMTAGEFELQPRRSKRRARPRRR